MGKITEALQKATRERIGHLEKVIRVPEQKTPLNVKVTESKVDARLVPYYDAKTMVSEQYKSLVTNLLSLNRGKPPKVITITSSVAAEGKSVTALNLAISMSHAIHRPRIVLVDADMRKGRIVKYLGVEEHKGLSEYLTSRAELDEILFNIDIEHLSFISSGEVASHPADLLASSRMKELLRQLRSLYDYVIIDTPPVIPVTDAAIIGAQADGVVLVIRAGETQRGIVKRTSELLSQAHANVVGHVLTGIEYFVPDYIYRYL